MGSIAAPPVAVVGDGLIGRSVRLAWLRHAPGAAIASLDRGSDLAPLATAEIVVLAAPVDAVLAIIPDLQRLAPHARLVMDTGSTKRAIVAAAVKAGLGNFVGGHPMAGGSTTGPSAARADLFDGRSWLLVAGHAEAEPRDRAIQFVKALGAVPVEIPDDGEVHDQVMAAVSHLPQIVASALLARVGESVGAEGLAWAGQGLRDTTRLAESPPDIWRGIIATNRDAIGPILKDFAADLLAFANRLDDEAAIEELFTRARRWTTPRD